MKEPRLRDEKYLRLIRQLPCLMPMCCKVPVEAAHIRIGARSDLEITESGSHKPHDALVLPLCAHHHRTGASAEHAVGTKRFWEERGVDPHYVALKLWLAHHNAPDDMHALEAMKTIVLEERFSAAQ